MWHVQALRFPLLHTKTALPNPRLISCLEHGEKPGARNGARDEFAPVCPFTTWLVEVNAKHNPGLDLERCSSSVS